MSSRRVRGHPKAAVSQSRADPGILRRIWGVCRYQILCSLWQGVIVGTLCSAGLGGGLSCCSDCPPPHVLAEATPGLFLLDWGVDFIFKKRSWLALLEHVVTAVAFQRAGMHSFIVLALPSHRIRPFSTNSVLRRTGSSTEAL